MKFFLGVSIFLFVACTSEREGKNENANTQKVTVAEIEAGIRAEINLGPDSHFACVDLADDKGDVYDVDFFLSGKPGDMQLTEMTLHKENGKPLYNWKQLSDKTWKRVDVEASDNRLMGVVEGEDRFRFRYEVEIPEIEDSAQIWVPVPTSNPWQDVTNVV